MLGQFKDLATYGPAEKMFGRPLYFCLKKV